jgi:cytochrome bd-type quinol oxidase subunit 2
MMIIYLVLIFLTVSTSYKEKIKLYADLNLKNYIVVITSGVFSVFFSIIMVSFVNGLSTL